MGIFVPLTELSSYHVSLDFDALVLTAVSVSWVSFLFFCCIVCNSFLAPQSLSLKCNHCICFLGEFHSHFIFHIVCNSFFSPPQSLPLNIDYCIHFLGKFHSHFIFCIVCNSFFAPPQSLPLCLDIITLMRVTRFYPLNCAFYWISWHTTQRTLVDKLVNGSTSTCPRSSVFITI